MFYQRLQTRENNENHEAVNRVTFVVLECFTNAREHLKSRGGRPSVFYCSRVFVTSGKARDTSL